MVSAAPASWDEFAARLSAVFDLLYDGDGALVIDALRGRYVQIAFGGDTAIAESVCNQFLDPSDQIDPAELDQLEALGWELPTYSRKKRRREKASGSPNHFLQLEPGWSHDHVAQLMADTLRLVHHVSAPDLLSCQVIDLDPQPVLDLLGLPQAG